MAVMSLFHVCACYAVQRSQSCAAVRTTNTLLVGDNLQPDHPHPQLHNQLARCAVVIFGGVGVMCKYIKSSRCACNVGITVSITVGDMHSAMITVMH